VTEKATIARDILQSKQIHLTVQQFQDTRDIIIMTIMITHGHRTGVITNATTNEFQNAPRDEDGTHVVFVNKHKTSSTYGPAPLVLNTDVHNLLKTHISQRASLTRSTEYLFCHHNGQQMTSNDVCRGLQHITQNELVTPTRIRKVVATKVLSQDFTNSAMENISSVMGHRPCTQRSYYDYRSRQTVAKMAQIDIAKAMELDTTMPTEINHPPTDIQVCSTTVQMHQIEMEETITTKPCRVNLSRLPNPKTNQTSTETLTKSHQRRAGYNSLEIHCINRIFNDCRGKSLHFRLIRQMLSADQEGIQLLQKYKTIQLRDKVKSLKIIDV